MSDQKTNLVNGSITFAPDYKSGPAIDVPSIMRSAGYVEGRAAGIEEAAKMAEAGVKASKREINEAMRAGNKNLVALATTAHDICLGLAFEIRGLASKSPVKRDESGTP